MKAKNLRGALSRGVFAFALFAALSFASALAVTPQLHEKIDGASPNHECVVTLIASGKYEQSDVPPLIVAPQPVTQFSKIRALNPIWVAAPFLGASIFEHAPPVVS